MADLTKEEIEAGMNAVRWHLNRLVSDLAANTTDNDVQQLNGELRRSLERMNLAWDRFCRGRDGSCDGS